MQKEMGIIENIAFSRWFGDIFFIGDYKPTFHIDSHVQWNDKSLIVSP